MARPSTPIFHPPWQYVAGMLILAAIATVAAYRLFAQGKYPWQSAGKTLRLVRSPIVVAPGIFMLGGLRPSAAYVVATSEGLVLVDTGLDDEAKSLKEEMATLGLDWKRVRLVLLTHAHGDHTGGARHLRQATGAKVYAGEGDVAVLRAGKPREAFYSTFDMPGQEPQPTPIDVALKGGEVITLGDASFQALVMPGHTPGSTCYLLERKRLRVLFSGDVIMMLRGDEPPVTELGKPLGTYSAYLAPRYRGDAASSLATLRRLHAMPVPDLLLPGHPGADVNPESPQLTQKRWQELLDPGIHDMEVLLTRYQEDGVDFLDGNPKELLPGLYYLGDFHGRAVYSFFTASRLFLVDAPDGRELFEFIAVALRKLGRRPAQLSTVLLTACGPAETAGLNELVEKHHTQVVAPYAALERLKETCPPGTDFLAAEDLAEKGWFNVKLITLSGRGLSPMGYLIDWAGKSVLISGQIPAKLDSSARASLIADLRRSNDDLRDYFLCMQRLHGLKVDLWLPAVAVKGQSANLYDHDWGQVIEENINLINIIVKSMSKF
jgi:glyoxylase-like metal-dependent hydrolase (beta-lactamase superfamily II)